MRASISAAVVGLRPLQRSLMSVTTRRLATVPELHIALGAFLLNFPWEFLQVPFFATMTAIPHWDGVVACTRATLGDAAISLLAYWVASLRVGTRDWLSAPSASGLRAYPDWPPDHDCHRAGEHRPVGTLDVLRHHARRACPRRGRGAARAVGCCHSHWCTSPTADGRHGRAGQCRGGRAFHGRVTARRLSPT